MTEKTFKFPFFSLRARAVITVQVHTKRKLLKGEMVLLFFRFFFWYFMFFAFHKIFHQMNHLIWILFCGLFYSLLIPYFRPSNICMHCRFLNNFQQILKPDNFDFVPNKTITSLFVRHFWSIPGLFHCFVCVCMWCVVVIVSLHFEKF